MAAEMMRERSEPTSGCDESASGVEVSLQLPKAVEEVRDSALALAHMSVA
jgi:hypothetical protein